MTQQTSLVQKFKEIKICSLKIFYCFYSVHKLLPLYTVVVTSIWQDVAGLLEANNVCFCAVAAFCRRFK